MSIELRYFSGTGNSWRVLETCRSVFVADGREVEMRAIDVTESIFPEADIVGFCFPVYAFGIPRVCRKYLKGLQPFSSLQKVFVLITAGDALESGFAIRECEQMLRKKNAVMMYSRVIQMPINWITSPVPPFTPSTEEASEIIMQGVELATKSARDISIGMEHFHHFTYPLRYTKFRFYRDYWMFKYLGVSNLWRTFKVYDSCNGCQLCARVCPTHSINMVNQKPVWSSTCEQCMRCANFCPQEAIYQSMGGDTKGRNRYHEPGFKPEKTHDC